MTKTTFKAFRVDRRVLRTDETVTTAAEFARKHSLKGQEAENSCP